MIRMSVRPAATASSTTYWIAGLSISGSISLGCAFVAGRNRVPSPAAGITALRIFVTRALPPGGLAPSIPLPLPPHSSTQARLEPRLHSAHADVRVPVHVLRSSDRGLPAHHRGPTDDLRCV